MPTDATEKHELQIAIECLHDRFRPATNGQVATYIPELGKADPELFGIALATTAGRVFEVGDYDRPFTIQSISKPFTFGMALEAFGHARVAEHVGVEPSGDAFNAIGLQTDQSSVQPDDQRRGDHDYRACCMRNSATKRSS